MESIARHYIRKFKLNISVGDFTEILKKHNPSILPPRYTVRPNDLILVPTAGLLTRRRGRRARRRIVGKPIPFRLKVDEISFKNNHPIQGVAPPEWKRSPRRSKPVCYTKDSPLKMDVLLKIRPPLAVTKRINLRVDGPRRLRGQKDAIKLSGEYFRVTGIETTRRLPDKVRRFKYNLNWSFAVDGGKWKTANRTGIHKIYTIFGTPQCGQSNFTEGHIEDAVKWAWGKTTETAIAKRVCWKVNGAVSSGCVCSNPDFNYHWSGARGDHSDGMCCCRAMGMIKVLQVLGVGTHVQDFVNERPEPNLLRKRPSHPSRFCLSHGRPFMRAAWGGYIYNNWQGVCKKADGQICYSPQGPHISIYETMNDAPEHPSNRSFDHVHAFEHYAWVASVGGSWIRCHHLPTPP